MKGFACRDKRGRSTRKIRGAAASLADVSLTMKWFVCLLISLMTVPMAGAGEKAAPYDPARFFNLQIRPILKNRCFECHSKDHEIEGGLALDSRAGWEIGGDQGPAVKPNDLKHSPLIYAIRHLDSGSAMPPDEKLPAVEIALLETWVLLGAPDPRGDTSKAR